jgi:ribonuclease P protein component
VWRSSGTGPNPRRPVRAEAHRGSPNGWPLPSEARNVAPASLRHKGSRGFSPDSAPHCFGSVGPVHLLVSASRAVPDHGPRAAASRRLFVEAYVSTEQPQARQDPWLSAPHAHQGGPRRVACPPRARAEASLGLIWRVRDRATFEALAGARRRRAGPVSLRFLSDGSDDPPRVAYAIGRRVGNAVTRNRIRRRLRAAIDGHASELLPGGAYLFSADRPSMNVPFPTLSDHVVTLLQWARDDSREDQA